MQNIEINERLKNKELKEFIDLNFVPSVLMSYEKSDMRFVSSHLDRNDPILSSGKNSERIAGMSFSKDEISPKIIILGSDETKVGEITISGETKDLVAEIKKAVDSKK